MKYLLTDIEWNLKKGEKSLMVIRHAKSSWNNANTSDFDRPLNERGFRDAPEMGKRLFKKKVIPQALISSPALRAKTTAQLIANELQFPEQAIVYIPELYHAPANLFHHIVAHLDDNIDFITIFSHNPGITDFVNQLTNVRIDNMPTCGILAVKASIQNWTNFAGAKKELLFFDYPKNPSF